MYRHYWQLAETPFAETLDPRFYYPAEPHQGALLKLRYALEQGRGAAALTGPSGSGKTLLLLMLRKQLDERFQPFCHLTFPKLPGDEFLAYLAEELSGTRLKHTPGPRESLRMIEDALAAAIRDGRRPVLVVDESHALEDRATWDRLRLLLNLHPGQTNPLTLLFVGHTTLLRSLQRHTELDERTAVKCRLRGLDRDETAGYVMHRLRAAGMKRDLLDRAAVDVLYELTAGIPRRINRLCDLALVVGYAQERTALTVELLESVHGELLQVEA